MPPYRARPCNPQARDSFDSFGTWYPHFVDHPRLDADHWDTPCRRSTRGFRRLRWINQCVKRRLRHGQSAPLFDCSQGSASVRVSRNKWIPGYRARATYAPCQFSPWSSHRLGLITVVELDWILLFRHFSRPKQYLFPFWELRARPPIEYQWSPRLKTSAQIAQLYSQNYETSWIGRSRLCLFA